MVAHNFAKSTFLAIKYLWENQSVSPETYCVWFQFLNTRFFLSIDTLLIDYQFTFSLSQEDDRYYTAINFVATPDEVRYKSLLSLFWICVDLFLGHYG